MQKISYHIRAPGFIINRVELHSIAARLVKNALERKELYLDSCIDLAIYRQFGSLRITSDEYYRPGAKRLQFETDESVQRMLERKNNDSAKKVSTDTKKAIKERAE